MKVRKEVDFNVLKILRSGDHPNDNEGELIFC